MKVHLPQHLPDPERIARILSAALQAVDPAAAVRGALHRQDDLLSIAGQTYDLRRYQRVWIVGVGKAGAPMACATSEILGKNLSGGVVVVKDGHLQACEGLEPSPDLHFLETSHPVPDLRGVQAAQQIMSLLDSCREDDLVVCLISGGGSALLPAPVSGVSLSDLQELTRLLLGCAANIYEINTLRKHLDQVKGGGLARRAHPAHLVALILSDVVGNPLDVIASGPTVPDPSTFADAFGVLEKYSLLQRTPSPIVAHLKGGMEGDLPDTPKPGDEVFEYVQNVIIGSNLQAAQAALARASIEGFNSLLLTTYLQGEARQAGSLLAAIARQIAATGSPVERPACLIAGGETTVTLQGQGLGGRNMEFALGAVQELDGLPRTTLLTLATDGGDGPTDAAGAAVTGETLSRANLLGLHPAAYLAQNDSYHFFQALGDLLITGPTNTNVNDLAFLFMLE